MNVEPKRMRVDNTISFPDKDYEGVQTPHIDALVILARVAKWKIKRIMVDTGSSANILFNHCYEKIKHKLKPELRPYDYDLYGFDGKPMKPRGIIKLPVELGDGDNYITQDIEFLVVDCWSLYNDIFGRTTQVVFEMTISMPHLKIKFPTPNGAAVCAGDQKAARVAYLEVLRGDRVCVVNSEMDS